MHASPVHCIGRRAFTLIELLVVISVIALLIAILLPALRSARDTAETIACASNQRQMSLASSAYAADTGYYPLQRYDDTDNSKAFYLPGILARTGYITGYGVWLCPSDPEGQSYNTWYRDNAHPNWPSNIEYPPDWAVGSYGYNHDFFSVTKFWGWYPSSAAQRVADSSPEWHRMPIHDAAALDTTALKPLARIGMFADSLGTRLDSGQRMEAGNVPVIDGQVPVGDHSWLSWRHAGDTLNITFGDGHGERIKHADRANAPTNNKTYRAYFAAWHAAMPY